MSLFENVKKEHESARRARSTERLRVLSTLIGEIQRVAKRPDNPTDEEVVATVSKVTDSLKVMHEQLCKQVDPNETAIYECEFELEVLKQWLPEQLDEEQMREIIVDLLSESGSLLNMGFIQKHFKENYFKQYDARVLNKVYGVIVGEVKE